MADVNLGQVAATVWERKFGKKPSDAIFNSRALFFLLQDGGFKQKAAGGRLFEEGVEYAENTTFKSYGELETLDTTRIDVFDAAQFSPKICAGTVVYSELERLRAQGSSGKYDLLADKLENGKNSHIQNINEMCWSDGTGNGGKDFGGMQLLISSTPTTGTVGGINRATFAFWRNRQGTGTKTTTAFDNLRAQMRSVYNQCSLGGIEMQPTGAITTRAVFEGYESLLIANERFTSSDKKTKGDADAAFKNDVLTFKGAKLCYDEDAPSGNLYFFNPKVLKLTYYEGGWMKMYPEVDPANQLSNVHKVATFGNMTTSNPRHLGVVTAID
jgi:hypothetical protein